MKRTAWRFFCQWPGLLRPLAHEWVDFTPISLRAEWTRFASQFEVEVWLLGVGCEFQAYYGAETKETT